MLLPTPLTAPRPLLRGTFLPPPAAAIKALTRTFGKWHGISSLFNLAVLVAAVAHGWWLAGSLFLV